ncbi:PP2C family protein-serine/threonine phosphatase [Streptomyces sp. NPDC090445]|uniref:PP2C family protein-serine/threonine phosphatase n=1 Tax=Streptomyces sp. NPDC090445 TaxID=3365963 RepID=UPI0038301A04
MTTPAIDYRAAFRALPGAVALLTPDLVYVDVNDAYGRQAGRSSEQMIGRGAFDVFPANPQDPDTTAARGLQASLQRVLATGEQDAMALQRYDIENPERPGEWEERYWSSVFAPVLDAGGRVELIVHRVEEVTELIRARTRQGEDAAGQTLALEAKLYTRARELQEVNERLRRAHAQEREVALALQEAMLPKPQPPARCATAVRYRPATRALNVCGDWYDLVELPGGRVAVAVGDVVGHGLPAACVMGQLRSALSAATRVADGPAAALDALDLYAPFVDGAESTTAISTFIDFVDHTITYSSAGHLPPALVHPDGSVAFLDQATDPPLGVRPGPTSYPQATTGFIPGATLALYTDGLIERRHEDIDTGLARLAHCLAGHRGSDPETLATALLTDMLPADGATDDTALVIIRL